MENKFVVGKKAYVLRMHLGRNTEPEIAECTVEKIGRKYIYVSGAVRIMLSLISEMTRNGRIQQKNYLWRKNFGI